MGYPAVELVRDYEAGTGAASQARFLLTPGNSSRSGAAAAAADYTWWVPLSLTSPARGFDTTAPSQWLDPATAATSTQVPSYWRRDGHMTSILTSDWRRVDLVTTTLTSGGPELGGQGGGRHPERAADRLLQSQLRPGQLGAAGA